MSHEIKKNITFHITCYFEFWRQKYDFNFGVKIPKCNFNIKN